MHWKSVCISTLIAMTSSVPLERTRGVTERTDVLGKVVIPLREDEVREAVRELVEQRSKAIVICLLQSHKNPESERRARDLAREKLDALGSDIPVFASVDYYPSRKESHRINTTILEAYAAEPSRLTLKKVSDRFRKHGARFDLRVMATHGGTISWKAKELARTIVSRPDWRSDRLQIAGRHAGVRKHRLLR